MSAPRLDISVKDAIVAAYLAGEPIAQIAARFGVNESYPGLLTRRRGHTANLRGAAGHRVTTAVAPSLPTVVEPPAPDAIPLTDTYAIRRYRQRVPNRTALGTSFMTEKAECHYVSLPLLSIQVEAA